MPFAATETGEATSNPIELFKFVGTFNTYRLTSAPHDITNSDGTYEAIPISRSELKNATQAETDLVIDVTMPFNHPLVLEYAFAVSPPELSLQIIRVHRNDYDDTAIMWNGKPTSFTVEGRVARISVPSIFAYLLNDIVPEPRYQGPCNHVLYDDRCKVNGDAVANRANAEVTNVNEFARTVTVDALALADGSCVGGEMVWAAGGQRRMIMGNVGTVVTLSFPFIGLTSGEDVIIRRGCDHSFETCRTKFSNGHNFGGCPLVPPRNPFTSRI